VILSKNLFSKVYILRRIQRDILLDEQFSLRKIPVMITSI